MFALKYQLVFSDSAKIDVADIMAYTIENWGEKQLANYKEILDKTFILLQQNPRIGKNTVKEFMVFPVGEHCIFYKIEENTLYITRILHKKTDISQHIN